VPGRFVSITTRLREQRHDLLGEDVHLLERGAEVLEPVTLEAAG